MATNLEYLTTSILQLTLNILPQMWQLNLSEEVSLLVISLLSTNITIQGSNIQDRTEKIIVRRAFSNVHTSVKRFF